MQNSNMYRDTITICKSNCENIENIKANVQKNKIFIKRSDILIEAGDKVIRSMSNGGQEQYLVVDPGFHEGLGNIKAGYQMDVKKDDFNTDNNLEQIKDVNINKKIFIVHGHDDLAKITLARFLERLDLEPVILHEKASSSKTIIEKIESYGNVGYAIVLYTPCDTGAKKDSEQKPRARQNVVFEHGYFIGRLSRAKVTALVKGNVETPNDISGVVYIDFDDRGAWKMDVAKELLDAGFQINLSDAI